MAPSLKPRSSEQAQEQRVQQANLMYDLLHIEIEKIRRKAIAGIQKEKPHAVD